MTRVTLTPHGQTAVVCDLVPGWNRLTSDLGVWLYPRDPSNPHGPRGVQFRGARGGWYGIEVDDAFAPTWKGEGYLPPRPILTVRPDSPAPTMGLLRPYGVPSDFSGGGGKGIDACGAPGTVHDHDATMNRCAIGLFDMATGKLRDARGIPVEGYYRMTRGLDSRAATNKVATLPDYSERAGASQYDDGRLPRDATSIPVGGSAMRSQVLAFQAYDGQHYIRAYRFALTNLSDPIVRDDMRALLRDGELAWDQAREESILASAGGRGHGGIGREWAWVAYLAAIVERQDNRMLAKAKSLFGIGFASRMRRIARHVAHRQTGILQRFVEGMSGSPYPFGPLPGSGVPTGQKIGLTQHLEACAQIVALEALGLKREAEKLASTILAEPGLKWFDTDTGTPMGGAWHGPAEDQAWPAIAAWLRINRRAALRCVTKHKVPGLNGAWLGPFPTVEMQLAALKASPEKGKCSGAVAEMEKALGAGKVAA